MEVADGRVDELMRVFSKARNGLTLKFEAVKGERHSDM